MFAKAAILFQPMAERFGIPEAWLGLAAALLGANEPALAASAMRSALASTEASPAAGVLAARIAAVAGSPGWCGLSLDGVLLTDTPADELVVELDAVQARVEQRKAGGISLPANWSRAQRLSAFRGRQHLLGSPIDIAAIMRLEGFVERDGTHIVGTAWLPAAPARNPELTFIVGAAGAPMRVVADILTESDGFSPVSRARSFRVSAAPDQEVRVVGADGRDLLGSPLPPSVIEPQHPTTRRRAIHIADTTLAVDVIIPVYRGLQTTLDCLASVLASVTAPHRIVVVDDASPEPELVAALADLARSGRIILLATGPAGAPNRGYPAAVNVGLRHAGARHAILLNSDTLVPPGWLEALRDAACSAPDIGTATPLSNEASIFSTPDPQGGNPAPDLAGTSRIAALAARANGRRVIDVPTAHGFCMFVRADCLAEVGPFDETSFAQGYGEENDFTERARLLGWRHVAATGVYVAHHGGVSFGGARQHLLRRNLAILHRRYPDYRQRVDTFIARDKLAASRRRLEVALWHARPRTGPSVLLITHGIGGGTARVVAERAEFWRARGHVPIVLREVDGLCEVSEAGGTSPNLAYDLPRERQKLADLLRPGRPQSAELHHLLGHDHSILDVLDMLAVPYDVWVHDYGWFCARLSFVTGEGRFCGEADPATCELCLARWGRAIDDPVAPAELRRRSAADMAASRSVVVPSLDVARRVARHAPGATLTLRAWESDPPFAAPQVSAGSGPAHVAIVGAIGLDKGYQVLLACARDAAERRLNLRFTVIGYTVDDDALMSAGNVFITGEFARAEARELIRAQEAHLALLPSVWPETWCYALSDIWSAGLSAVVFDIGTPAERVRASGRGWVLPLGLPASRVCDALLGFCIPGA